MNLKRIAACVLLALPAMASAAWQTVATEQGKRVEIDRASVVVNPDGGATAKGRIVLDKPIVDPKTSASYRIIEVENRFDCTDRTYATLKRTYYKDEGEFLRTEEVKTAFDMPVRSGTPDDKLLREVCRPKSASQAVASATKTAEKVGEASDELRKLNASLIEKEAKKDLKTTNELAAAILTGEKAIESKPVTFRPPRKVSSYAGVASTSKPKTEKSEASTCTNGRRQSPIDLRDGIAVDLEPIGFAYQPASFRVADSGNAIHVVVYGGSISLLGKQYDLSQIVFRQPSETTVNGKAFDMEAQLLHRSSDGKQAIVSVLLEKGTENPAIQTVLNNLPLEKGIDVMPPAQNIDMLRLLPSSQRYFTFMGSQTTPPCTEDVLWMVLKQAQQISPEQLAIFQRLHPGNTRPVQPGFGRMIKESR